MLSTVSACIHIITIFKTCKMDTLICDECGYYLSHAPVYLRATTGESICSVCSLEEPNLFRNRCYEIIAQHIRFPCKYEEYGCDNLIVFCSNESEEHPHEIECKYKAYICPLCDWDGPLNSMHLHFMADHPTAIFDNPCILYHNIEYSNIYVCLIPTNGELFLLQAEVLLPEGLIYHSIRLFGKTSLAHDFNFELVIQKNDTYISRIGDVLSIDNENIGIVTKIDNLLDLMDNFENIQFTINIQNIDDLQDDDVETFCHFCNKWRYLQQGICHTCKLDLQCCSQRAYGCCKINLTEKIDKHEKLFCNFMNWCEFCDGYIYPGSKSKTHHYLTKHTTYELGGFVPITRTYGQFMSLFFRSEYGIVCCNYYFSNKKLEMQILAPLMNAELRHLCCKVFVEGPGGHITEFILELAPYSFYDWLFYLQKCNFSGWNSCFNVKIEIERD